MSKTLFCFHHIPVSALENEIIVDLDRLHHFQHPSFYKASVDFIRSVKSESIEKLRTETLYKKGKVKSYLVLSLNPDLLYY